MSETNLHDKSVLHSAVSRSGVSGSAVLTAKSGARTVASPFSLSVPVCRIVTFHPGELSGFLWTLPALQALREGFPGARLCVVVRPSLAPFLRDSPLCDEVLMREKGGLSRQTSLMLQLRNFRPDVAVSFSRSRLSTLLAWSSGAEERVGFAGARLDNLLTQRIECDEVATVESFACLAQALGCAPKKTHARDLLTIPLEAEKRALRVLEEHQIDGEFIVAMCDASLPENVAHDDETDDEETESASPHARRNDKEHSLVETLEMPAKAVERAWQAGARAMQSRVAQTRVAWPAKKSATDETAENSAPESKSFLRNSMSHNSMLHNSGLRNRRRIAQWPAVHWAVALRELGGRAPVVLVGAAPAPELTSRLESRVLDLGGTLEPVVLAAILRRAQLFVGSDSGVLHLAAAVGTPVVGIYGPTDWRKSGPRGVSHRVIQNDLECAPCELQQCLWTGDDERKCLTQLAPERVVEAARELIGL